MRLAAGAGSGFVRGAVSQLAQVRTDAHAGVAARLGEGGTALAFLPDPQSFLKKKTKSPKHFICLWLHPRRAFDVQELSMRQPLHRKKLQLALQALGSDHDLKGRLDHNWVTSKCRRRSRKPSVPELERCCFQGGWTTSASRSTNVTLRRLALTGACCTT